MASEAHTGPMLSLAFIEVRSAMRRRLIGARGDDPVLRSSVEQRRDQPVDGGRPAQRGAHVPFVAPKPARGNEHLA